jgi:4'-phosphopantetheinyl transferase
MNVSPPKPPSLDLVLGKDDIHIWHACLDTSIAEFRILSVVLSPDEKQRAERFHFEIDRRRFIICRGILRSILGSYMGIEPDRLHFCYGEKGKPEISDQPSQAPIRFNASHSHGIAVFAFARCREIGIDVEMVRDIPDMVQIAKRFFSAGEFNGLSSLPESKRKEAFFNCWTRKEAFIKAIGDGLTMPLDSFEVSLVPGEPAELLKIHVDREESPRWCIQDIGLDPPHISAFAIEDDGRPLDNWQWFDYKEKPS